MKEKRIIRRNKGKFDEYTYDIENRYEETNINEL